jgi:hypothetical protein
MEFLRDGPRDAALVGEAEDYGGLLCVGHFSGSSELFCGAHSKCGGRRVRFL